MNCHGNVDNLIAELIKDGKKHGHNSGFLTILEGME